MGAEAPYVVHLEPDVAQQLADQGGTLLILDLPEGSYFGIDHMAFHCGPRFRGIKMLPPGPHFACYSVPGSQRHGGGMGPVIGFFFNVAATPASRASEAAAGFGRGSVLVRRYDAAEELLMELPEEEAERYTHGVRRYEFDWGLAPYNLHAWRQWRELTSCLDARIIDAIQPVGGNICTAMEAALEEEAEAWEGGGRQVTAAEAKLRQQLLDGRAARAQATLGAAEQPAEGAKAAAESPAAAPAGSEGVMEVDSAAADGQAGDRGASGGGEGGSGRGCGRGLADGVTPGGSGRCFYSPLPRLVKEAGLTPTQLTALNLDRTQQLVALAAAKWGGDAAAVVGEMQFAFIAFVFGQSLQGFRQWRALVTLLLNCETGPLASNVAAFTAFTAALRSQLSLALADAPGTAATGGGAGPDVTTHLGLTTHGSLIEEVLLGGGGRDCFLRHHLATFFEVLREAGPQQVDPGLQAEMLGEDDDDEYAPVVVELEEGLQT